MSKYPKPPARSSCLLYTLKQSSLLCNISPEFTLVRCPCYKSQAHLGNPVFRERRETQRVSFSASYPYWKREWKLVRTLIVGAIGCSALLMTRSSVIPLARIPSFMSRSHLPFQALRPGSAMEASQSQIQDSHSPVKSFLFVCVCGRWQCGVELGCGCFFSF